MASTARFGWRGPLTAAIAMAWAPGSALADEPPPSPDPAPVEPPSPTYTPISLALVTPAALPPVEPLVIGGISLNILYGRSRSTFGLELGAVINHETDTMGGIQVSPVLNIVESTAGGIQVTGGVNYDGGACHGLIFAGIANYCGADGAGIHLAGIYDEVDGYADGLQVASFGTYAKKSHFLLQVAPVTVVNEGAAIQLAPLYALGEGNLDGLQLGLLANVVHSFRGIQIAGAIFDNQTLPVSGGSCGVNCQISVWTEFPDASAKGLFISTFIRAQNFAGVQISMANVVDGDADGFQLGALANGAGRTAGVQIASSFNYADDLDGMQLGFMNIAKDVKGVQIGAINVARELTGLQIGVINVAYANQLPFMVVVNAGF